MHIHLRQLSKILQAIFHSLYPAIFSAPVSAIFFGTRRISKGEWKTRLDLIYSLALISRVFRCFVDEIFSFDGRAFALLFGQGDWGLGRIRSLSSRAFFADNSYSEIEERRYFRADRANNVSRTEYLLEIFKAIRGERGKPSEGRPRVFLYTWIDNDTLTSFTKHDRRYVVRCRSDKCNFPGLRSSTSLIFNPTPVGLQNVTLLVYRGAISP